MEQDDDYVRVSNDNQKLEIDRHGAQGGECQGGMVDAQGEDNKASQPVGPILTRFVHTP